MFLKKITIGGFPLANHKSSEKRARQTIRKNARNSMQKSIVKTVEKKLMKGIESKSADLNELLKAYVAKAMSAVSKGILKKQTVSRKVSRLSTQVHKTLAGK